jgi:four helix bundle protein
MLIMSFRFQKFPIYSELKQFTKSVYKLSDTLPRKEKYELASQLRRVCTSILLNLAEGSMKKSDKEFRRFVLISVGSLGEIVAILDICFELKYISPSVHKKYMLKSETLAKKLYGFARTLKG